jgi:hypothetical protein
MRKADLKKNHIALDTAIARYRTFMEKIVGAQRVVASAQEKRDLAESIVLRLCANWESFVDNHLVDCINRDWSKLSEFFGVTVPNHPSAGLCWALLFGDSYRDFRSYGDLKGFSKKILVENSNPFLAVTTKQSARIDEVYKMRNYLSHLSGKSRRALNEMYKTSYKMQRFLEPGQFLLAYDASRLWMYFDVFEGASTSMKNWYGA